MSNKRCSWVEIVDDATVLSPPTWLPAARLFCFLILSLCVDQCVCEDQEKNSHRGGGPRLQVAYSSLTFDRSHQSPELLLSWLRLLAPFKNLSISKVTRNPPTPPLPHLTPLLSILLHYWIRPFLVYQSGCALLTSAYLFSPTFLLIGCHTWWLPCLVLSTVNVPLCIPSSILTRPVWLGGFIGWENKSSLYFHGLVTQSWIQLNPTQRSTFLIKWKKDGVNKTS